jgi:hypothetical protein
VSAGNRLFELGDMDGSPEPGPSVGRFRLVTEGSGSGILTDQPLSAGYRLKESKIAEVRFSWSHAKVLEAAGLLDSHVE